MRTNLFWLRPPPTARYPGCHVRYGFCSLDNPMPADATSSTRSRSLRVSAWWQWAMTMTRRPPRFKLYITAWYTLPIMTLPACSIIPGRMYMSVMFSDVYNVRHDSSRWCFWVRWTNALAHQTQNATPRCPWSCLAQDPCADLLDSWTQSTSWLKSGPLRLLPCPGM